MSTHEDLEREVEATRQELGETVDELVHKVDVTSVLRDYGVPIALMALGLVLMFAGRSGRPSQPGE